MTDPGTPDTIGEPADRPDVAGPDVATRGGTEVEPRSGWPTESKIFLGVGAFYVLIGLIYLVVSDGEWAGVALLLFAGGFSAMAGIWLIRGLRPVQEHVEDVESSALAGEVTPPGSDLYLPVTSVWPLGMAIGIAMVMCGFAVGWVLALPGAGLLAHSIIGFANQSRQRHLG